MTHIPIHFFSRTSAPFCWCISVVVAFLTGCASTPSGPSDPPAQGASNVHFRVKKEEINKIAVGLKRSTNPAYDDVIENAFSTVMQQKDYNVITRSVLNNILQELNLQQTGIIDQSSAIKVGQLVGATHMVIVSLVQQPGQTIDRARIVAQMVDVRTGTFVGSTTATVTSVKLGGILGDMISDPLDAVEKASFKAAQALP